MLTQVPGVVAFVGAGDVPGRNSVKCGESHAQLFATNKVECHSQMIGLVLAETPKLAAKGAALVNVTHGKPEVLNATLIMLIYEYFPPWYVAPLQV